MTDLATPQGASEAATASTEPAAPSPAASSAAFEFRGDAREYFRIWIVNLFLSLVTLGIYSAWAKVRKKRYFYANTWLAGANFDYHGDPKAILRGRIIAVAAFLAYTFTSDYFPNAGRVLAVVLTLVAPWLIVRSMQFNAASSSYRNLRFAFRGRVRDALRAVAPIAVYPIAVLLFSVDSTTPPVTGSQIALLLAPLIPLALVYPYVVGALKRFQINHAFYGSSPFACAVRVFDFYKIYVLAVFVLVWLIVAAVVVLFVLGSLAFRIGGVTAAAILSTVLYLVIASAGFAYTRARVTNLSFNASSLAPGIRFKSTLSGLSLWRLYLINLLAIAVSLGLLVPWAVIRTAHYRASCLSVEGEADIEATIAAAVTTVAATGDELGEFFSIDLAL